MGKHDRPEEMRVVVLGAPQVGKSAVTVQFINGVFIEKYAPSTEEDSYRKMHEVIGITFVLEIIDTANPTFGSQMREVYLKQGEAFLVIYNIASHESLEAVHAINTEIRHAQGVNNSELTIVVMANKCDLDIGQRQVTEEEGRQVASSIGACAFFETSAKRKDNIFEAFSAAVSDAWGKRKIREAEEKQKKKGKKKGEQGSNDGGGKSCILA